MMRLANRLSQSKRRIIQLPIKAALLSLHRNIEVRFVCKAGGKRGADVRPDLRSNVSSVSGDGCPASLKVVPESIHIRERTAIRCRRSSLADLAPLSRR